MEFLYDDNEVRIFDPKNHSHQKSLYLFLVMLISRPVAVSLAAEKSDRIFNDGPVRFDGPINDGPFLSIFDTFNLP
jgi:hypothetical protein